MILTTFFLQTFLIQIAVIAIIIFILLKILNRHLIELGIHDFEVMLAKEIAVDLTEIVLVTCQPLAASAVKRIEQSVCKKLNRSVKVLVEVDKKIKGGIIIKLNKRILDYSLISRLKESGFIK